ncbi:MAG: dienelactone hydrolase family protein [Burkholderiales bacterium]
MQRIFIGCLIALCTIGSAFAKLIGEPVEYRANGLVMNGYLAYDSALKGKRPGVLVVHEWWGHNEYARKRARMLAGLGYTALAVDMYGGGKHTHHPDDAGKFAGEALKNLSVAKARFDGARRVLQKHPSVDARRIAAIGYCFGGTVVLEMARAGENLEGVVSFHGNLGTAHPAEKGAVKAKVLVLNGADDPFVTQPQIDGFKKEMEAAGADYKFISYPGAKHSFTNPDADKFAAEFNMPLAYNAEADQKSWAEMQVFFNRVFRK